jgi:hypothetical protein
MTQEFMKSQMIRLHNMERTMLVLFGLLLLAAPATMRAQFTYTTNADGISLAITSYYGSDGAVSIPDAINGLPVTSIGNGAFFFDIGVTSVTIPSGITSIGNYAFLYCTSLTAVNFQGNPPDFVGSDVFYGDSATVYYSPCATGWGTHFGGLLALKATAEDQFDYATNAGAITITGYFGACDSVIIPSTINDLPVTSIGDDAFFHDTSLTNVTIPDSVTSIGSSAFYDCVSLASIAIPGGVSNIGDYAFDSCVSLPCVTIPSGVSSIGYDAFFLCDSLTAITVDAQNPFFSSLNGVLFDKNQTTLVQYPCGLVGSYTIPSSVTSIEGSAFFGCFRLTSVTIPRSITSILETTFSSCGNLTNVMILGNVTNIGGGAFVDCPKLTSVYFHGNAPTVGEYTFNLDNIVRVYYLTGTTGWTSRFGLVPSLLWNPMIQTSDGSFGVRSNQFGFNITGTANIPIAVEACANLASPVWTPLQALKLTNGSFYFSDPQWTNFPVRFYRISSP